MAVTGHRLRGVIAAAATPFRSNLEIDHACLGDHVRALLAGGCHFVSPFGTTGEASSIDPVARMGALEALVEDGVPAGALIPGTGAAALSDTIRMTAHACALGPAAVLILPPFYYGAPCEDGLAAFFEAPLAAAARTDTPVILYNIPQMTKVPIWPRLICRLRRRFGSIVAGVKDSSGDWKQTMAYLELSEDISVFPGNEALLETAVPLGAAGCISGSMNVTAEVTRRTFDMLDTADRHDRDVVDHCRGLRAFIQDAGLMQAVKALLWRRTGHRSWSRFVPPLRPFSEARSRDLADAFERLAAGPMGG